MTEPELPDHPVDSADLTSVPGQPIPHRTGTGAGRDTSFSDFYRASTTPLIAFLILQGAGLADAADIAQETMTTAYRRWPDLWNPKAWVYRVASRALIRKLTLAREEPFAQPPEPPPVLRATAIESWEQDQDVARLLDRLPPRQRQVMAWTLAGHTSSEIAAELDMRADTVRSTLVKARRALIGPILGEEVDR